MTENSEKISIPRENDGNKKTQREEKHRQTGVPCATSLPEQMGATLHSVCWKAASTWRLPLP